MARELTFSGFLISEDEWNLLDDDSRLMYLQAFIETSPPRADGWAYESYELSIQLDGQLDGDVAVAAAFPVRAAA